MANNGDSNLTTLQKVKHDFRIFFSFNAVPSGFADIVRYSNKKLCIVCFNAGTTCGVNKKERVRR